MKLRPPHMGILLLVIMILIIFQWFYENAESKLVNSAFTSGWFLFGSFVALAIYGARKRVPFLPIGKTSSWLQLHLGLGLVSAYMFLVHIEFRIPSGNFESQLFILYSLILGSGFMGWVLMRAIPSQMRSDGMESNRSRIPDELDLLREMSDRGMKELASAEMSSDIFNTYFEVIRPYLHTSCGLIPSRIHPDYGVPRSLVDKIQDYVSPTVLFSSEQFTAIHKLVQKKAMLDRHAVFQRWLRGWLFIHVPLTGVMAMLICFHVLLIFGFSAGEAK